MYWLEKTLHFSFLLAPKTETGRSLEGRPIHRVSVSGNQREGANVWLVCGLHAREWASPLACLHIIKALVEIRWSWPSQPELQKINFQIVPLANPDSYVFSMDQLKYRQKRKNMADSGCSDPLHNGVDLNRNFPVGFNLSSNGSDSDGVSGVCSNMYGGELPFSEPETKTLRDALTQATPWLFIDLHCCFGAWLTPPVSR